MLISEVNIQNILHDFLVIWSCQEVHVTSWVFAYYSKLILKVRMMEKQLKIFSVAHLGSFCIKSIRVLTPPPLLNKMLDHRTLHLNIRQFLVPSNTIGECHCEWKYPSQKTAKWPGEVSNPDLSSPSRFRLATASTTKKSVWHGINNLTRTIFTVLCPRCADARWSGYRCVGRKFIEFPVWIHRHLQ